MACYGLTLDHFEDSPTEKDFNILVALKVLIPLSSRTCVINRMTDKATGTRLKLAEDIGEEGLVIGKKIEVFHYRYLIARAHMPFGCNPLQTIEGLCFYFDYLKPKINVVFVG